MQAWESPIVRVSTGKLNTVNDVYIGGQASIGSRSKYAGQLGKSVFFGSDQIANMFSSSVGTLYTGAYMYVKRRAADDASPSLGAGKLAFWDTTVTGWESAFQVTTDANLSSASNAMMRAGIFIGNITPGRYGFIQWLGEGTIRYRSVLTVAGAIGGAAYAADVGDTGLDQGTADCLTTDATSLPNARFLGWQVEAGAASSLKKLLIAGDAFQRIG